MDVGLSDETRVRRWWSTELSRNMVSGANWKRFTETHWEELAQIHPESDLRNRIERNGQQENDWCCRHMIDVEGKAELQTLVQDMKLNS